MSRRPKSFLVMLLVAMFLMTQVAAAGADWSINWGSWASQKANGENIEGTVTATAYASVYVAIDGSAVTSTVVYQSGTLTIPVWGLSGGSHTVTLAVYENANSTGTPDTAQYYNNSFVTQKDSVMTVYNPMSFTLKTTGGGGGGGGGGGTITPPATTPPVTPTVNAPASTAVTAEAGGTVTAAGITVSVPAGALEGNGTLSVTPVTDLTATPVGTLFKIGSTVVDIVVSGASLTGTLTISLDYDKAALADVPAEQIGVFYFNEARNGWVFVGGSVDAATGKVSVDVNHLTKFAVMAQPNLKVPADVKGHWAYDSMYRLLGMGVVAGYPDGTYKPNNNITRAEFAKIIVDAMGWHPAANPALTFADADQVGDWAKGYVATAVQKGLIAGYSDNTFKPANQITRAEIAAIVVKALGKSAEGTPVFADASDIPAWAAGYIAVAAKEGIVSGYTDSTFKAGNNATRAEAAKMTTNLLTNLKI